jgi:hypothetical protein
MGLDTVRLAMEVEEAFDITIDDGDAQKIQTVGDLHRYILRHAGDKPTVCPSAALFYRLRRALMDIAGVDRRAVRPSTPLGDLLPVAGRRAAWTEIQRAVGPAIPDLHLPDWSWFVALGAFPALLASTLAALWTRLPMQDLLPAVFGLSFVAWIAVTILVLAVGSRLATEFEPGCETVGGVVRTTLPWGDPPIAAGPGVALEPEEVWSHLRRMIAALAEIPPEQVTEDVRFIDLDIED